MPVYVRELSAPKDIQDDEIKNAERVERFIKTRNKVLSDNQVKRIESHLKKQIKSAKREYEPLRRRLSSYSDLLEGIVEETTFPFEGASNVTLRYGTSLARTFAAKFNKTVYQDEDLAFPVFDPGSEQELKFDAKSIITLQDGFNHSINTACNAIRVLKCGTIPAFRDGTFLLEGSWERRIERVNDQRTYRDFESFQKDFPDHQSAGISEEEYISISDLFLVNDDCELIARFSYDHVQQDGIEYRQIPRAKFLVYPTTVKKLWQAQLYGCTFELTKDEIKERQKKGEFYEDGVKRALARRGGEWMDAWDRGRLFVEGRAAPLMESIPYKLADIVFKYDLDNDKTLEQYSGRVIMEGEEVILVALRPYEVRHNIPSIIPFRLLDRDYAFDGISLLGDGKDIFDQVDILFRHDNNVMMLTTSPMFIADQTLKDEIDLGRAENVLRPGVTFWVPNPDKQPIRQLQVQDIAAASGDNNTKISILSRFVEMLLGVSQGESGNQTPDDPRAPAHKTQLLLMQAGDRIDQCIDTWCYSFEEFFKLHATLLYQFSRDRDYKFMKKQKAQMQQMIIPGQTIPQNQQSQVGAFNLDILASEKLHWKVRRRSIALTPEYSMNRLQTIFATYAQMKPLIMQGDPVAVEVWNRIISNSNEPQAEKFLIDPQQAPQMQNAAIQKAMQQFKLQSDMKAHAKGKEKLAMEASKAVVKHLSEQAKTQISGAGEAENQSQPQPVGVNGQ